MLVPLYTVLDATVENTASKSIWVAPSMMPPPSGRIDPVGVSSPAVLPVTVEFTSRSFPYGGGVEFDEASIPPPQEGVKLPATSEFSIVKVRTVDTWMPPPLAALVLALIELAVTESSSPAVPMERKIPPPLPLESFPVMFEAVTVRPPSLPAAIAPPVPPPPPLPARLPLRVVPLISRSGALAV